MGGCQWVQSGSKICKSFVSLAKDSKELTIFPPRGMKLNILNKQGSRLSNVGKGVALTHELFFLLSSNWVVFPVKDRGTDS